MIPIAVCLFRIINYFIKSYFRILTLIILEYSMKYIFHVLLLGYYFHFLKWLYINFLTVKTVLSGFGFKLFL